MSSRGLLGDDRLSLVCVPLVSRTHEALLADARAAVVQRPDVLEWRVDHFEDVGSPGAVVSAGLALREAAGRIPLICTLRSRGEGGCAVALSSTELENLRLEVARQLPFEFHDVEMRLPGQLIGELRKITHSRGGKVILSAHDFECTPTDETLESLFLRAHQLGGDVAKVAVMPISPDDVLRLLTVTRRMSLALPIPVISMSMGSLGVMTRIFGGVFGSAMTFATSVGESAPGQIALKDLREILDRLG